MRKCGTSTASLRGRRIDIFDEQRLVALLVIDEIVDLFFREQKAEATRPKALLFANGNVAKEIASRTVDGSMPKLFEREALTRIFDAHCYCSTGTNEGNFNIMARVELPAMPHRIQKNFAERSNDGSPIGFRNGGISNSTKELDQAICCLDVATGRQANPSRRTREDFDAVIPARRLHGFAHHFDQSLALEGTREVTEGAFPHGVKDVPRRELIGEYDKARMRANGSDLVNDFQVLWALVSRPCNDQGEGVGRGREEGSAIVGNMFNAPAFARKNAVEQFIDLSAGINYKRGSLRTRRKNGRCSAPRCQRRLQSKQVSNKTDNLAQRTSRRREEISRLEAFHSLRLNFEARNNID